MRNACRGKCILCRSLCRIAIPLDGKGKVRFVSVPSDGKLDSFDAFSFGEDDDNDKKDTDDGTTDQEAIEEDEAKLDNDTGSAADNEDDTVDNGNTTDEDKDGDKVTDEDNEDTTGGVSDTIVTVCFIDNGFTDDVGDDDVTYFFVTVSAIPNGSVVKYCGTFSTDMVVSFLSVTDDDFTDSIPNDSSVPVLPPSIKLPPDEAKY